MFVLNTQELVLFVQVHPHILGKLLMVVTGSFLSSTSK